MPSREDVMIGLYKEGLTLQKIGDEFGVSRQRVHQIFKRSGVSLVKVARDLRITSRQVELAADSRMARIRKRVRAEKIYGCSYDCVQQINEIDNSALRKYGWQKSSARHRGIEWRLTLLAWWEIWQQSGKWAERGRGSGYCMARIGDTGPYEIGNVEIKTIGENFSESYLRHPYKERFKKRLQS